MAPKKRKASAAPQPSTSTRVTRSVSRSPARVTRSTSAGSATSARSTASARSARSSSESGRKTKKPKVKKVKQKKKKKIKQEVQSDEETPSSYNANNTTIVIEHSKQSDIFKTKAEEVKEGLEEKIAGITVTVNPKTPRKGCFQIRVEGGEKFISLMKLKRPYKRLKDLDTDKVISDIADKFN